MLADSYAYCRGLTKGSNFRNAFFLLQPEERDAISAIYAFMRRCDDLSDEPGATPVALERWREQLDQTLNGKLPEGPIWPAFQDTVQRYKIPQQYFHDMISGVTSDLTLTQVETFDELYTYCYRVASVAGLSLMHIFGNSSPQALELAEKCGIAFQLTNIIRDVGEDQARGRVYLPHEDMQQFGARLSDSKEFKALLRFESSRAIGYYTVSSPLPGMVAPRCGRSLWVLIQVYSRLLRQIEREDFPVLHRRVRLSKATKLWILAQSFWNVR